MSLTDRKRHEFSCRLIGMLVLIRAGYNEVNWMELLLWTVIVLPPLLLDGKWNEQVLFSLWRQSISFVDRFPNLAEEYTLFHSWTVWAVFTVRWLCCFNLETRFRMKRILLDKVYPCICNDPSVLFLHLYL